MPSIESYLDCIRVIELLQSSNISKVQPVVKQKVLIYSVYIGVYKALWYGFHSIIGALCDTLVKIGVEFDPTFG